MLPKSAPPTTTIIRINLSPPLKLHISPSHVPFGIDSLLVGTRSFHSFAKYSLFSVSFLSPCLECRHFLTPGSIRTIPLQVPIAFWHKDLSWIPTLHLTVLLSCVPNKSPWLPGPFSFLTAPLCCYLCTVVFLLRELKFLCLITYSFNVAVLLS